MMKILILGDTHAQDDFFLRILEKEKDYDVLLHTGDFEGSEIVYRELSDAPLYCVAGNNDFFTDAPYERVFELEGCRIFMTHGHRYNLEKGYKKICRATEKDLDEILKLQYLAYQSEAALFGTDDIPPLKQTIEEVAEEYRRGTILKMVTKDGRIIGSVRAHAQNGTAYIGKLMVHPDYRGCGLGSTLLSEIERYCSGLRYELFTSTRSTDNIRLYRKVGYEIFDQRAVDDKLVFVYLEKNKPI